MECVHRVRRSTVDEAKSLACSVDEHNIPFDAKVSEMLIAWQPAKQIPEARTEQAERPL